MENKEYSGAFWNYGLPIIAIFCIMSGRKYPAAYLGYGQQFCIFDRCKMRTETGEVTRWIL